MVNTPPEIVEIGCNPVGNITIIDPHDFHGLKCSKCGNPYTYYFDHRFFCLNCDEHKEIRAEILSLKVQSDLETEMRLYSGSSKHIQDYFTNQEDRFIQIEKQIAQITKILTSWIVNKKGENE